MNYRIIPVTAFSQNCSLIWCEQTRLAALVDPGGDAEKMVKFCQFFLNIASAIEKLRFD